MNLIAQFTAQAGKNKVIEYVPVIFMNDFRWSPVLFIVRFGIYSPISSIYCDNKKHPIRSEANEMGAVRYLYIVLYNWTSNRWK